MTPQEKALELYPPKYIAETWVRRDPDVNAPLRAAYLEGFSAGYQNGHEKGYEEGYQEGYCEGMEDTEDGLFCGVL